MSGPAIMTGLLGVDLLLIEGQGMSLPLSVEKREEGGENRVEPRKPGMLLAVALSGQEDESRALDVLRRVGAHHLERAEGTVQDGDWVDFDPLSKPVLIA